MLTISAIPQAGTPRIKAARLSAATARRRRQIAAAARPVSLISDCFHSNDNPARRQKQEEFDKLADIANQYLSFVNSNILYEAEAEIKNKTGIKKAVFNSYEEYINKNIEWSDKTKMVLSYYKKMDEISKNFETRKLGIVKSNGKYTIQ